MRRTNLIRHQMANGAGHIVMSAVVLAGISVIVACSREIPAPGAPPEGVQPSPPMNSLNDAFVLLDANADIDAFRIVPEFEDTAVLDDALRTVFGTTTPPADGSTVLALLRYVPQVTRLEFLGSRAGSDCLKEGKGICTNMALAFVALCRRAGLPARMNSFHNFGLMQGHNTAEVYLEGGWRLFDPTFGTFFCAEEKVTVGRTLSLRELSSAPAARRFCFRVTDTLWTGKFVSSDLVEIVPRDYLCDVYGYSLNEFYDSLFAHAFPTVPDERTAASFPIDFDLREHSEVWAGMVDQKTDDLFGVRDADGNWPRFHGFSHLGKTRHATAFHTLTLRVPKPGSYRLTYHFAGGDGFELGVVELRGVFAGTPEAALAHWAVNLFVQESEAVLLVMNRRGQAYIDAIHIARIAQ